MEKWMKTYNHMKGWAPGLALKMKLTVIRKWPIVLLISFEWKLISINERILRIHSIRKEWYVTWRLDDDV